MDDSSDYEYRTLRIRARRLIKEGKYFKAQELYENAIEIAKEKGDKSAIKGFENIVFKISLDKILARLDYLENQLNKLDYTK
ncbi:MAG: hypothetical protein EU548_01830 [Promethearchaeota archaeon]|nr:MAG: hypothetical protein EU548_01830 [Candidatus Lokiarchaeota archaeon]